MKKTNSKKSIESTSPTETIIDTPISNVLINNYMPYAMSVIVSRAIPEIDGFKPSHRKLLYTMYKMGLLNGARTKSANIVGQTMKLNPHGDQAIYETMVRLTKSNESLLCPLVDSKGNFGKHFSSSMAYAASRYTEAKLMKICTEFFSDLDKDAVDMIDNYDGTMLEPRLLPVSFPSILTNPTMGIAVSMASNICSFNLEEVCKATILRLKNPKANIFEIIKAPDFSTGGDVIYNEAEMQQILSTGRGSIKIRARYRVIEDKKIIEVYEIPYSTTIENIIDDVVSLVKNGDLPEVVAIRDETDKGGLKIAIDYKKGTNVDLLIKKLYKYTKMTDSFGCNFNILINGAPDVYGVPEIIDQWVLWRRQCVNRILKYDLKQKEYKYMLLQGLEKIALNINKAVKIVKDSENDKKVISNLMVGFKINETQAEYIAEIKLRNFNKDYILTRTKELKSLEAEIEKLKETIDNEKKIDQIIIKQLEGIISKYSEPRKTGIIPISAIDDYIEPENNGPDNYKVKIIRTLRGYLKKINNATDLNLIKLQDDDKIIQCIEASNLSEILFFSSNQNVYKIKVASVKDMKPSDVGEFIPNLCEANQGEKIMGMAVTNDFSGQLIFAFENGKLAKIPISAYQTKTNRKKLINSISSISPLIAVYHEIKAQSYILITSSNMKIAISSNLIPEKSTKTSAGVQAIKLKEGETLSECIPSSHYSESISNAIKIPAKPKKPNK